MWSASRKLDLRAAPGARAHTHLVLLALDCEEASGSTFEHWKARAAYDSRRERGGISMLQSHLQKCVRRGRADLAVQSARELVAITWSRDVVGLDTLLRRLPIIIVEDLNPLRHKRPPPSRQ